MHSNKSIHHANQQIILIGAAAIGMAFGNANPTNVLTGE